MSKKKPLHHVLINAFNKRTVNRPETLYFAQHVSLSVYMTQLNPPNLTKPYILRRDKAKQRSAEIAEEWAGSCHRGRGCCGETAES